MFQNLMKLYQRLLNIGVSKDTRVKTITTIVQIEERGRKAFLKGFSTTFLLPKE